jgi:hypothetical protein
MKAICYAVNDRKEGHFLLYVQLDGSLLTVILPGETLRVQTRILVSPRLRIEPRHPDLTS